MKKTITEQQIELPSEYSPIIVLFLTTIGLTIFLSIIGSLYLSNWKLVGDDWKFLLSYSMIGFVCLFALPTFYRIYIRKDKIKYIGEKCNKQ